VPYLSASAVVIHYEEALYQVYAPVPLSFTSPNLQTEFRLCLHASGCNQLLCVIKLKLQLTDNMLRNKRRWSLCQKSRRLVPVFWRCRSVDALASLRTILAHPVYDLLLSRPVQLQLYDTEQLITTRTVTWGHQTTSQDIPVHPFISEHFYL